MATIEEKLLGFQIVRELNTIQESTLSIAGKMKAVKDPKEAEAVKAEAGKILDRTEAKLGILSNFLSKYPGGPKTLARAYQDIGVTPKQITDEMANLGTVAAISKESLAQNADVVETGTTMHDSVEAHIPVIVDPETHYGPIQMHVACWDLVSALALTLMGLSPGNGGPLPKDSTEKRKDRARGYLKTFSRAEKYLDDSAEAVGLKNAATMVGGVLDTATTLEQLTGLGVAVDALVPRVPLVRRGWQYD